MWLAMPSSPLVSLLERHDVRLSALLNETFDGHIDAVDFTDNNTISMRNDGTKTLDVSPIMDWYNMWHYNRPIRNQLLIARTCALISCGTTEEVQQLQESVKNDGFFSEESVKAIRGLIERAISANANPDIADQLLNALVAYNDIMEMVGMPMGKGPLTFKGYLETIKRITKTMPVKFDSEGQIAVHPFRGDAIGVSDFSKCKDGSTVDCETIGRLIRERDLDNKCTIYFLSDFEGRFHTMLAFLLAQNVITIESVGSDDDVKIVWNDPTVFVVQCGDAVDDIRWAAPEQSPKDSGKYDEKHPEELGRDFDAWFVFDYLRRISRGNFINIFGNHDLFNVMENGTETKYNIANPGLYPNVKYVTKDSKQYTRIDFAKRFVFPFYSISFIYLLRIEGGARIIASHAGVHPEFLKSGLEKLMEDVHVQKDIDALVMSPGGEASAEDSLKYKVLNGLKDGEIGYGVTSTRLFDSMCSLSAEPNLTDAVLGIFNELPDDQSYVQVFGHNKENGERKVHIKEVVPGKSPCNDTDWTWTDSVTKYHVACMVDALDNTNQPTNVLALKYNNNKFEKITVACTYAHWGGKIRKIVEDNLYKLEKGDKMTETEAA